MLQGTTMYNEKNHKKFLLAGIPAPEVQTAIFQAFFRFYAIFKHGTLVFGRRYLVFWVSILVAFFIYHGFL